MYKLLEVEDMQVIEIINVLTLSLLFIVFLVLVVISLLLVNAPVEEDLQEEDNSNSDIEELCARLEHIGNIDEERLRVQLEGLHPEVEEEEING